MSDQYKEIGNKLDKLAESISDVKSSLSDVKTVQAVQKEQLGEHIRRTEIAEQRLDHIDNQLEPIRKHVLHVEGVVKGLGVLATIVAIVSGILRLFGIIP